MFALLRETALEEGACALHSLNISEHDYKLVGELDFVLVSRRGILVLEVKGGRVKRENGIWTFTDRFGNEHRRAEGPFEQARSGMFALRHRIEEHFGTNELRGAVFGFGAAFPEHRFDIESAEWAPEMVLDARSRARPNGIKSYVDGLFRYWEAKTPKSRELSRDEIAAILRFLRPGFDRVPVLSVRAERLTRTMAELTEEQYAQLDCVEENRRIFCSGGAGTGKTFLAAELARRQAALGKRVLIACASPILAAYLDSCVSSSAIQVEAVDVDALTRSERPDRAIRTCDALVVDEGQDLLNTTALDYLDTRVVGGLQDGEWCFFVDANRQTGLTGRFEPEALEYLRSCGAVNAKLSRNCRNTEDIVTQTRLLTAADLGQPSAGQGPPVKIDFHGSDAVQLVQLEERLASLRDDGVPSGEITILSPLSFDSSCVRDTDLNRRGNLERVTPRVAANWPPARVTFAAVADFKGLENNFILVVDIDDLSEGVALNTLYVAMSRARVGLWITVSAASRQRVNEIMKQNLALMVGGFHRPATPPHSQPLIAGAATT